ncbi:MAG TPA: phosphopantetheine-binding protein [Bauldia sp.]|nr:phosphopantetheine-binding protein [Bauldia sp.]
MADVTADVISVIAKKVAADKRDAIKPDDSLKDLGLESIDALEMIFDLEEKFGIQIPYNANSATTEFATVGDVVKAIQKIVDQSKSTSAAT